MADVLQDPEKWIIRTSDRGSFRKCRQLWDYSSKLRQNFEYVPGIEPLNFGIAYHAGMEVFYDPMLWGKPEAKQLAEAAFGEEMLKWKRDQQATGYWDANKARWEELLAMGLGMMRHYWIWQVEANKHLRPVLTEIEFEVPIPVPISEYRSLPSGFEVDQAGHLTYLGKPVVYQGRIDVIVENTETGGMYIMDHKTAAQFRESLTHLDLDPQCGSYAWAARKMLNLDIRGIIYSEHRKKVPRQPAPLKSGAFSKNKSQDTTAAVYRQAVIDTFGVSALAEYGEFIEVLRQNEQPFFRRTEIDRNGEELISVERNILNEAIDMLNDPRIYPNPNMMHCGGCAFAMPCLASQDGSGDQWVLIKSGKYRSRTKPVEGDQG